MKNLKPIQTEKTLIEQAVSQEVESLRSDQQQNQEPQTIQEDQTIQEAEFSESSSSQEADSSHIDEIDLNEWAEDEEPVRPEFSNDERPVGGFITKNEFYEMIKGTLDITGRFTGLEPLPIQPNEVQSWKLLASELWEICYQVKWLNFIIKPSNPYIEKALIIIPPIYIKYSMCKAFMAEKRAEEAKDVTPENKNGDSSGVDWMEKD